MCINGVLAQERYVDERFQISLWIEKGNSLLLLHLQLLLLYISSQVLSEYLQLSIDILSDNQHIMYIAYMYCLSRAPPLKPFPKRLFAPIIILSYQVGLLS